MDDQQVFFEPSPGMYRFFEGIEDEDSGVEDLPFTNYVELDCNNETNTVTYSHSDSIDATKLFGLDEDELTFMDDDKDEDYKPRVTSVSKRVQGHTKIAKRRQYPNTSLTGNKIVMLTPEKQIISQCDTDSNSSIRHYARKDRTPNTIKKMMERHRESERVRHHSLNESLKDVCMRVPGYDPGAKETKVIQMQRIIGYECFLENTFRALCEQLNVPSKLIHKFNNQFISDAMNTTPIEDFYQPSSYRTSDGDEDEEESDRLAALCGRKHDLSHVQMATKSTRTEDPRILKYPREKISSPTVDSTTDNIVCIGQLYQTTDFSDMDSTPRYLSQFDSNIYWSQQQTGFKTIDSSQQSSQESGIKVETQSSLDDDNHFHEINNLMEDGLYNESEHLRTVTPSFMHEETVSTSTCMDDTDEGFDLSSPVRYKDSVFLHSPPARGIWHSISKHHLPDKADTPGHKEMESVSPENILETKPKVDDGLTDSSTSTGYHSSIRPMTEILSTTANYCDKENTGLFHQVPESVTYPSNPSTSSHHFTKVTPTSLYHSKANINTNIKTEQFNVIETKPMYRTSTVRSAPSTGMKKGGKVIKTIPVRNVKIQIVHASPSQRSLSSKLKDTRMVSSTSADQSISPLSPSLVNKVQEQFDHTAQNNTKENDIPKPEECFTVTQLKKIPVPAMSTLQELPGTIASPLQCTTSLWSPEAKNKRKRYTPFRSPFRNNFYEDSDEENWSPQVKKQKLYGQEDLLGEGTEKLLTRSTGGNTIAVNTLEQPDVTTSELTSGIKKLDYRRSTWMNGFMIYSQLNRHKYQREHPGTHISVTQKLLGHQWRSMLHEEQLPYIEKADQQSGFIELTQTCPSSIVDSSSSLDTSIHRQEHMEDPSVITIAPEYWQF